MKTGKLVFPTVDNDGYPNRDVHRAIERMLIAEFGGFHAYGGVGGYNDGSFRREPVRIYITAGKLMLATGGDKLKNIAIEALRLSDQRAVYIEVPTHTGKRALILNREGEIDHV